MAIRMAIRSCRSGPNAAVQFSKQRPKQYRVDAVDQCPQPAHARDTEMKRRESSQKIRGDARPRRRRRRNHDARQSWRRSEAGGPRLAGTRPVRVPAHRRSARNASENRQAHPRHLPFEIASISPPKHRIQGITSRPSTQNHPASPLTWLPSRSSFSAAWRLGRSFPVTASANSVRIPKPPDVACALETNDN
jgi:hypothetical protein